MPWDDIARRGYARPGLRYASDLTDREWAVIEPFLPPPRRIGRPRSTDLREVVNAVLYMAATGCQWRMLPKDLPPHSTVQRYFYDWRDSGLWRTISNSLVMAARELEGREASPSAGVIDRCRNGRAAPDGEVGRLFQDDRGSASCSRPFPSACRC
jgi:transposase